MPSPLSRASLHEAMGSVAEDSKLDGSHRHSYEPMSQKSSGSAEDVSTTFTLQFRCGAVDIKIENL